MIRILKRLFRLMSQYKGRLYLGIALSMISNILGIVPIICGVWTIKLILDDSNGAAVLEPVYVLQLTTIILGSVLLRWLFAYIRATRQDSIAHEVTCAERLKIGDILKRVSLGFLQRKNMGEFTTAITTDLAFFEMQTMNVVNNIIDSYIFLAITIIWLLCFSPFLGGAALLAVAISTAGLQLIERQSRKNSPIRQESINEMADEIVQYVRGMAVVKSFKQEGVASDGLYRAYHKSKEINIKMERNFAPCDALHRLGLYMGTMAITCITALLALQGEMELYMAIMLIVYSYIMFNTIESANNSLHILEMLDTVAEKLQSIEDAELCLSIKKSCKRAPKKRAPSTPNKLVRTAWGEPQRTPFGTLTDHALLQEFWSPFARVGRTKRSRPFAHILEPPSPFSKRTALPVHGLRKTVAFTGENHNMAVVD